MGNMINKLLLIAGIILLLLAVNYITGLSGRIVDADTGESIIDAVVLVEWTRLTGALPGLTSTEVYKVIETRSDKDGKYKTLGVFNPFANRPSILIYKQGYTIWYNKYSFPDYEQRNYSGAGTIQLKKFEPFYLHLGHISPAIYRWDGKTPFDPRYSHSNHIAFIETFSRSGSKINRALEWETQKARDEKSILIKLGFSCTVIEDKANQTLKEATVEIGGFKSFSDKDGKVNVSAEAYFIKNPPDIKVYKKGYVLWEGRSKFDNSVAAWNHVKDGFIFKLAQCDENQMIYDYCYK